MKTNRFAIVLTWGLLGAALSLLWSTMDLPQTTTSLAATSMALTGQNHPIAQESSSPHPWVDMPADGPPAAFKPGELLVRFREGTPPQAVESFLQQHSAARLRVLYDGRVELWQVPEGRELAIVAALRVEPSVEYAEPNYAYYAAGVPNDPDYGNQWAHPLMQSPAVWDVTTGTTSITIAVIDTGIDTGHPDLAARIVAGYDFVDGDSDPSDTNGHGTHVSGIAAAVTNNGVGVAGMDWNAQLMPIRVLNTQGAGFTSDIVDGINWAWQQGADVLNLSMSGPSYSQAMQDAVTAAHDAGSLVVAGMGNDNSSTPQYPAAYNNVLAVAATGPTDTKASYSNYGAHCDVAAPGGDMSYYHDPAGIYSTMPTYPVYLTTIYAYYQNYDYLHGTSQAAPYVSGLAALIWSVAPGLAPDQVQAFIETTAVDLGTPGWDQYYGHGRIDALAAVQAAGSATQWTVCPAGPPDCDYSVIQDAVDAASQGDTIKIATGSYTGVHARPSPPGYGIPSVITQVVYISKTLTLRGGYTTTNWLTPDPEAHPTTLDAQGQGRVLLIAGPISPTIEGLRLTGGDASGLDGLLDDDAGGGIYVINATATLSNCTIYGSTAGPAPESVGGGLFLLNSHGSSLLGNTIADNTAYYGGGLLPYYSDGVTLNDNTIISNTAQEAGGGLFLYFGEEVALSGNTFVDNVVEAVDGMGGGMWGGGEGFTANGNTFVGNTAPLGGGLAMIESSATLTANTLQANVAADGGGAWFVYSNVALTGNTILSNTAGAEATGWGGGLCFIDSDAVLADNTILANHAMLGGGLHLTDQSTATLRNTIVADNHAEDAGSGLYIEGASSRLWHTTLARNTGGDGSGLNIHGGGSTVALTNTILVSQTVGITVAAGSTALLEATLWHGNGADTGGAGTLITGTINLRGDPAFVNPGAGDYHLGQGSAAINTGIDVGIYTDIDGDPRPLGLGFDLGADEYAGPALVLRKSAYPNPVESGGVLTYTLRLTNTGALSLTATLTDVLPAHVAPGGTLTWTPPLLAPGDAWAETVVVTVEMGYTGPLTNVVWAATEEGVAGASTTTVAVVDQAITGLIAANDSPTMLGSATTLTATVTAGTHITYTWAFGDGLFGSGLVVTHTYPAADIYTAVVTASNPVGWLTATTQVEVVKPHIYLYLPLVLRATP